MIHIHKEVEAGPDDIVEVALDGPANVMLLDAANYGLYRQGKPFHYQGGASPRPHHSKSRRRRRGGGTS